MKSSAQEIRDFCKDSSLRVDKLTSENLFSVYKNLRVMNSRAEFSGAAISYNSDKVNSWADEFVAVIVDNRPIVELQNAIRSVIEIAGLKVHIFHGIQNKKFVTNEVFEGWLNRGLLKRTLVECASFDAKFYNRLLLDSTFWQHVAGRRKILVFQSDSICCAGSDHKISDFKEFDYIGANWHPRRPIGLTINGGCGGFSLRDWSSTMEVLRRFPPQYWPGGEDGYFAFHIDLIGGRVANVEEMSKFASQTWYNDNSFGAHQVSLLSLSDHTKFVNYCPEIETVLGWK